MKTRAILLIPVLMLVVLGFVAPHDRVVESVSSRRFTGDSDRGQSCTIIYASDGRTMLAGNNEDYTGRLCRIHFLPGEEGKFGRVYFGFDVAHFPQGGMNERGLFFDAATFDEVIDVPRDPSKPTVKGQLILKAMEECATVDEVLMLFEHYDYSGRMGGQYLVGDSLGNSAIIEPTTVIRKQGRHQIATNFAQSQVAPENITDYRYRTTSELFEHAPDLSVDLFRRILGATHFEEPGTVTLYSYICVLRNGEIYIYNFHNFADGVKLNLREELAKGERIATISSLFPYETYAQKRYAEETGFNDD